MANYEFTKNMAKICIVGAGKTGVHAVSSMTEQLEYVTCIER